MMDTSEKMQLICAGKTTKDSRKVAKNQVRKMVRSNKSN